MKKFLSAVLALVMMLSLVVLSGCGEKKAETLKFGMGVASKYDKATDADGDTNGSGQVSTSFAAVLLDKDGKIVKCVIDTAQNKAEYTADGKAVAATEFKTKYEKGSDYGMVASGQATKEWYEQIDAFTALIVGKTIDEVKALVAEGNKGTDEVINAGCTITIDSYVAAVEKAVANAEDSEATAADTLKLGAVSSQYSAKDATDEAEGLNQLDTTMVAAVVNKDGKVVVCDTDAIQAKFTFNAKGAATLDTTTAITSKKEQGTNYGMASYGKDLNGDGVVKEWDEQAAAFNAACVGLTADEIAALVAEGDFGVESLQTAGCTIKVADMAKSAVKAATV